MQRTCPDWVRVYEGRKRKADFEDVMTYFGMPMMGKECEEWVTAMEKGEERWGIREGNTVWGDEPW